MGQRNTRPRMWSTALYLIRNRNCLPFHEHLGSLSVFWWDHPCYSSFQFSVLRVFVVVVWLLSFYVLYQWCLCPWTVHSLLHYSLYNVYQFLCQFQARTLISIGLCLALDISHSVFTIIRKLKKILIFILCNFDETFQI